MSRYVRTLLATGPLEAVERASRGHREHLRQLRAQGRLAAAGEFRNGDGFLDIFEARDLYEAEAVARASPLVALGLCSWMLREWIEIDLDTRE